jgi:hypothetical protein
VIWGSMNLFGNMAFVRQVLTKLIRTDLVTINKYSDWHLKEKIEAISKDNVDDILNNPYFWYPCNEVLAVSIT